MVEFQKRKPPTVRSQEGILNVNVISELTPGWLQEDKGMNMGYRSLVLEFYWLEGKPYPPSVN